MQPGHDLIHGWPVRLHRRPALHHKRPDAAGCHWLGALAAIHDHASDRARWFSTPRHGGRRPGLELVEHDAKGKDIGLRKRKGRASSQTVTQRLAIGSKMVHSGLTLVAELTHLGRCGHCSGCIYRLI